MSFEKLLIIIILLIVINSLLTKEIKKLENKIESNKNDKLNFKRLAKKYIESMGYGNFIDNNMENIFIYEEDKTTLIYCKDLSKENMNKREIYIMSFISNMVLKSASKGIFIYSGELPKNINDIIKKNKKFNFDIEFINEETILSSIRKNILS